MPLWTAERQQLAAEVVLVTGVVMMTVAVAAAEVLEVEAIPRKLQEDEKEAEGAGAGKQSACAATSAVRWRGHCLAGCPNRANVCRSRP